MSPLRIEKYAELKVSRMSIRSLLQGGTILFDNLVIVDPEVALSAQLGCLREDMLQVAFGDKLTLDVGWYPSFSPTGQFTVFVIRDYDWEEPVYQASCRTLADLLKIVEEGVRLIDALMQ